MTTDRDQHGHTPGETAYDTDVVAVLSRYPTQNGGTYLDLWRESQTEEKRVLIIAATVRVNELAQKFIASDSASYTTRCALVDDFRTALNQLRELNGGHLPTLTTLD